MRRQLSSHFCPGKVPLCTYPTSGNAGQEVIELSELKETNLSLRSFMSGSPSLRAPWKRHFFMELKTSGSSISSESSDSTCSTSIVTKELVPKNTERAEKILIHNSQIIYTYQYHNVSSNHILLLAEAPCEPIPCSLTHCATSVELESPSLMSVSIRSKELHV